MRAFAASGEGEGSPRRVDVMRPNFRRARPPVKPLRPRARRFRRVLPRRSADRTIAAGLDHFHDGAVGRGGKRNVGAPGLRQDLATRAF